LTNLSDEICALRDTVDQLADLLTRIGAGPRLMTTPECAKFLGLGKGITLRVAKELSGASLPAYHCSYHPA